MHIHPLLPVKISIPVGEPTLYREMLPCKAFSNRTQGVTVLTSQKILLSCRIL
jgi:hypothetical protein